MRVLITSPIFPPDLGGPSVYVPSIGRFLVERGHQVKVIAFCSDPAPAGHPFEVESIARGPLPLRYLKAFWRVFREAKRFDVVYVQEHLAFLHILAAKLRGVPCVIRIMVDGSWEISHRKGWCGDDDIMTFQGKRYGWKVSLVQRLQCTWWRWAKHIITCSDFLRGILVNTYGVEGEKVQTIFNAYHGPPAESVKETREEARETLGLRQDRRYLLTICRLMIWKQVDRIIEALRELPEDVELIVCGDGPEQDAWEELARSMGLEGRVHFRGNVAHDLVPLYIRAADIFVLYSRYEGLSHTLIEVQTLGTMAVASAVCGNPEVVQDRETGRLVPVDDTRALAKVLQEALQDTEGREALASAGVAAAARFSRIQTFSMVEEALHKAAGEPFPGSLEG
ncbi:MAG: glycosyltransferase family 4 protein [Planctomycetes bacterium]|nr:glycosyltransferase family 4 protein [Planctomycetota bacterium]